MRKSRFEKDIREFEQLYYATPRFNYSLRTSEGTAKVLSRPSLAP